MHKQLRTKNFSGMLAPRLVETTRELKFCRDEFSELHGFDSLRKSLGEIRLALRLLAVVYTIGIY